MRYGAGCAMWMAAAALSAAPSALAEEDGPGRGVARVSVINGDVSVRRGDSGDWVAAAVNAPLVAQDTVATGPASRAELQFDYANMLRMASNAEIRISELEYRRYQVQVARGTVEFRVLRNSDAEVEVSTPTVSVRPSKKGAYRVTVREDGETEITARSGEVEVYTSRGVENLKPGRTMLVRNESGGPAFQVVNAIERDEFDHWNEQRDRVLERSASYRYVSPSIYGADDLDGYGRWVYDPPYGWVWVPGVAADWAPYRHGRWVWADWYGWSWVSYDPWGWAPFHYGRWYSGRYGWCWYPGAIHHRYYWSPGLVAFFGFGGHHGVGVGVGFGWGRVGWVPLAPHEPYYPWYGRNYYRSSTYVDRSVHVTNINVTNVYRNARVNNGVSMVEAGQFGRGRAAAGRASGEELRQAALVRGQLPLGPSRESTRFTDRQARVAPPSNENQRFYTRRQPTPVERVSFSEQQRRFQAPSERAVTQPAAPANPAREGRGWHPAGEARTDATRAQSPRADTPAAAVQAPRPAERSRETGWRRFGEQPASTAAPKPVLTQEARPAETPARRGGGDEGRWRRFGEPQGDQPQVQRTAPQRRNETEAHPERNNAPQTRWQRFGEPGASPAEPRTRIDRPAPRSMEIAPPVVRERSAPRMESPRMERPAQRAEPPRMERSAPRPEGRVERSAPRVEQSAPRGESRGSGARESAPSSGNSGSDSRGSARRR